MENKFSPKRQHFSNSSISAIAICAHKKRYSVEGDNIDAAVAKAKADGLADAGFEAEIDWSFDKMTLSYKLDVDVSNEGFEALALPSVADAVKTANSNMPKIEMNTNKKNWGSKALKSSGFVGPVVFNRYMMVLVLPVHFQHAHPAQVLHHLFRVL